MNTSSHDATNSPYKLPESNLKENNPALFDHLIRHPEIQVVSAYFQLESLQFHTLYYVTQEMTKLGYTPAQISEAYKIYMEM
jgi:hypothetical protein